MSLGNINWQEKQLKDLREQLAQLILAYQEAGYSTF